MRHAWLIMTHANYPILEKQLAFLDSENADVFIHVDARAAAPDMDRLRRLPRHSNVTFIERRPVSWGDLSQILCELALLKAALPGRYDYYHLLSGVDVPVKPREYIEAYFEKSPGTNYIDFNHPEITDHDLRRVKYYYPFQKYNVRKPFLRRALRVASVLPQMLVGVDRTRAAGRPFQKGANWFSITHGLAEYVVSRETDIEKTYRATLCADEVFLQTEVLSSPFRATLSIGEHLSGPVRCLRYVDWKRGRPYTFTDADYDELVSLGPDWLFARKFDYRSAPGVVDRLFEHFSPA